MIKTVFFDIDGTLVARGALLPGAVEAVAHTRRRGLALRCLTNITGRTPAAIAADLQRLGLALEAHEIQTASTACVDYLRTRPAASCHLIVPEAIRPLFDGLRCNDQDPDVVVIADIGERFDFNTLNRAFRMLRAGAELVAPQKGLFWFNEDGAQLDCGSFILGLEAASGQTARVTGKPEPLFFQSALAQVGGRADQTLVVGDDIGTDVRGAAAIGAVSALVATGKYQAGAEHAAPHAPDHLLRSLLELPALLDRLSKGPP
jgi:HAD superfamily hydrolase (TIGR01458 family)